MRPITIIDRPTISSDGCCRYAGGEGRGAAHIVSVKETKGGTCGTLTQRQAALLTRSASVSVATSVLIAHPVKATCVDAAKSTLEGVRPVKE